MEGKGGGKGLGIRGGGGGGYCIVWDDFVLVTKLEYHET